MWITERVALISALFLVTFDSFCDVVAASETAAKDELSPGNWDSCRQPGAEVPNTRVDTLGKVRLLRNYFATAGIDAYLIPSEDAHQSEYTAEYDKRRSYISGLKGSAGFAVVTIYKQALWTDGRYFLQAENTLDCNWILMRQKVPGVPSITEWLTLNLNESQVVGASPFLLSSATWKDYEKKLAKGKIKMKKLEPELLDYFWTVHNGRPPQPNTPINVLPMQFAGRSWQDKVSDVRAAMAKKGVDMMVITGLDETAWLFNLRASDIAYNPFFISYAIIETDNTRLYILDHVKKLSAEPIEPETKQTMAEHLNTDSDTGTCEGRTGACVQVLAYNPRKVVEDIKASVQGVEKVWLSFRCNYAIYSAIPQDKIYEAVTPIALAKTKKNPTEVQGMKNAHLRDAAALISFMAMLEQQVQDGVSWNEMKAAETLKQYRGKQEYNRGDSFAAISSFGSNGAIIHYTPSNLTSKNITTKELYLLDSGGQYLDGTTDVTRTFHFGTPTDYEKECYTRVWMGQTDLFQTIWPKGKYGREIDAIARRPLWNVGLRYRHGTGHGIGMYLSVHEGPGRIALSRTEYLQDNKLDEFQFFSDGPIYLSRSTNTPQKQALDEFQFISDEPGYYEDGQFGIRLEDILMVKNATTKYRYQNTQFLTFEHVSMVPYEPKLLQYDLLSDKQIAYLNNYNKLCRTIVGPELQRQGLTAGYNWMIERTAPYVRSDNREAAAPGTSSSSSLHKTFTLWTISTIYIIVATRLF